MICKACANVVHQGQPTDCRGGTWCDCAHRLPAEIKVGQTIQLTAIGNLNQNKRSKN